ncbi:MAG: THUMP domain-containing protein [Rheinheimera sp.]|nr:THUMP domain-containing protein [Rheinheimera sp.]
MVEHLQCIPGIVQFAQMESATFTDLHDIFEQVLALYRPQLEHKSFCVRVRRQGNHPFTSTEAERYIGGGLNQHIASAKVQLHKPDVTAANWKSAKKKQLIIENQHLSRHGRFPVTKSR